MDGVADFLEIAVIDVAGTEAKRRRARVDVVPVVVVLSDGEMAPVLVAVVVRVADQRGLPVVVEEGVGDGDIVGCVGDLLLSDFALPARQAYINEPIIIVLVMVTVRGQIAVVNPHIV